MQTIFVETIKESRQNHAQLQLHSTKNVRKLII